MLCQIVLIRSDLSSGIEEIDGEQLTILQSGVRVMNLLTCLLVSRHKKDSIGRDERLTLAAALTAVVIW